MAFITVDEKNNFVLQKPIRTFIFISASVGLGVMLFVLLLYGLIQAATSSGFSELKSTVDSDDRERIDDNDDLEDV